MDHKAVIIGSGPNGLACGIALAQAGLRVEIFESAKVAGGGMRTEELTLPGFHHDVFSTAYPMAAISPYFQKLPLKNYGLEWVHSPAVLAHPFDDSTAALLYKSLKDTSERLGRDEKKYFEFFQPLVDQSDFLMDEILRPVFHLPKHFWLLSRFGFNALKSAERLAALYYEEKTKGLWGGIAAHSATALTSLASSAPGLALQVAAHAVGWPIAKGGAGKLAQALISYFNSLGGVIHTGIRITDLKQLPPADLVFFDLSPPQISKIGREELNARVQKKLKSFRPGNGVFKMDWALDGPIPWASADASKAAIVHLGGSFDEVKESQEALKSGRVSSKPYVLLGQPTPFDPTRAPLNKHVAWAYCHVPNGDPTDISGYIENQIERFAPGFKKIILKRSVLNTLDLEGKNQNLIGGDLSGGLTEGIHLLFRPGLRLINPYAIDGKKFWICSSSTPPGPGVHGMCGFHAARSALRTLTKI